MMRAPSNCYRPRGPCYFCIKIAPAEPLGRTFFFPRSDERDVIMLIVLVKRVKLDGEIAYIEKQYKYILMF